MIIQRINTRRYSILLMVLGAAMMLWGSIGCSVDRRITRMNEHKPQKVARILLQLYPIRDSLVVRATTIVKHDSVPGPVRYVNCDSVLKAADPLAYAQLNIDTVLVRKLHVAVTGPLLITDSVFITRDSIITRQSTAKDFYNNYVRDSLVKQCSRKDDKVASLQKQKKHLILMVAGLGALIAIGIAIKLLRAYLKSKI